MTLTFFDPLGTEYHIDGISDIEDVHGIAEQLVAEALGYADLSICP